VFPSTAGVADTSPPVVNVHLGASVVTFAASSFVSAACQRVFSDPWPATSHRPSPPSLADAGPAVASAAASHTSVTAGVPGTVIAGDASPARCSRRQAFP
jgi:hypothetical protein